MNKLPPHLPIVLSEKEIARFWSKVNKTHSCWLWTGRLCLGYGSFLKYRVHRVAYSLVRGPITDGLCLDHICRVRACVNPDHLEPVTGRVNILRGIAPPAINARKTHCKNGHELTPENTAGDHVSRGRKCRKCMRAYHAEYFRMNVSPNREYFRALKPSDAKEGT